jgi:hypothetical protein
MISREQLVLRALRELRVVGAGQSASAEDAQAVDDDVEPVLSDLAARNVWQWGDPDQIDEAAAVHIAVILANSVAGQFGQPSDEIKRLSAEARLKELDSVTDAGDPINANYF